MAIARPAINLTDIVDKFGTTMLSLVTGDPEHQKVRELVLYEGADTTLPPDSLVLLIGVHTPDDIAHVLPLLEEAGVRAVITRAPCEAQSRTAKTMSTSNMVVLTLHHSFTWTEATDLLRSYYSEHTANAADPRPTARSGNLFALADAVAVLLHAPVTIEDRRSRVIAFSQMQSESDESRIATILGRQVPELFMRYLAENGVFDHLHHSDEPIWISADLPGATRARVAVALRAGDEFLGSMWVAVAKPLTPEQNLALRTSANLVALHLRRQHERTVTERRLRADLVTTALGGGRSTEYALTQLGIGIGAGQSLVLSLGTKSGAVPGPIDLGELIDAFAMHLGALHSPTAVALVKGTGYAILTMPTTPTDAEEQALQLAHDFLIHVRTDAIIGIGRPVTHPLELVSSREDAERALEVVRAGRTMSRVATFNEVHLDALLLQIATDATGPGYSAGGLETLSAVDVLAESDAIRGTSFVPHITAWLDAFGNVGTAAASLNMHPNSFRYRLRQLCRYAGCDLDDPETRFQLMLHLRLLNPRTPGKTA